MAKTREVACIHYRNEGNCALGKDGTFRKKCQTCKTYKALPGGSVARPNLKRKKLETARKKDLRW